MTEIVIHADDFGLCAAVNQAIIDTLRRTVTATSVMTPCPGFRDAVVRYHQRPEGCDVGLHCTLTVGGAAFAWQPMTHGPSLVAPEGGMWRSVADLAQSATAADIRRELDAQLSAALAAGIDLTHLDSHMFVGSIPAVAEAIMALAWQYRLPCVLPNGAARHLISEQRNPAVIWFDTLVAVKSPEHLRQHLGSLRQGRHYLIVHPGLASDELTALLPRTASRRVDDHRLCSDGTLARLLHTHRLSAIGMRELRDSLRYAQGWV